jgi:hypothetical protein
MLADQTLVAIIQLMGGLVSTEGVSADNKKTSEEILTKCLNLLNKNVSYVHAKEVAKLELL